jgi:hypothetical protein
MTLRGPEQTSETASQMTTSPPPMSAPGSSVGTTRRRRTSPRKWKRHPDVPDACVEHFVDAQVASDPLEWNFARDDLAQLMDRLAAHEPRLRIAA